MVITTFSFTISSYEVEDWKSLKGNKTRGRLINQVYKLFFNLSNNFLNFDKHNLTFLYFLSLSY